MPQQKPWHLPIAKANFEGCKDAFNIKELQSFKNKLFKEFKCITQ